MLDLLDYRRRVFEMYRAVRELGTAGVDPEWPLWYAGVLMDKLPALLGTDLTKSELVYLLVHLSKEQPHQAPDMPWPRYYARFFAGQYPQEGS